MTEFVQMEEQACYNEQIDLATGIRKVARQESLFNNVTEEDDVYEGISSNSDKLNQGFSQK